MTRVLVVSRNFPPLWGGMERLNLHLVDELARCCEVRLIAPEGAGEHASASVQVTQVTLRPLPRFLLYAAWQTVKLACVWKPDVILGGSGLMAPLVLLGAWVSGARSMVYVHGLDLTVPNPVYRVLWRPALRRLDRVVANSNATAGLAKNIGISGLRISIMHPGVSLQPFDSSARQRFRSIYGLEGRTVLLSVGRLAERKGLREFVTDALPAIVLGRPDVILLVVGSVPANALYAEAQTPESIQDAANAAGVGAYLRFVGNISDSALQDAFAGSDLHVFPVRHIPSDPEGFGMVAIEAAAQGLATVAYATGGVVDAVSCGVSGRLVPPGDSSAFARAVLGILESPLSAEGVRVFAEQFAWQHFGERIRTTIVAVEAKELE